MIGVMSIANLIEPVSGEDGPTNLSSASDWMQGRTLYGGASALVAFTHANRKFSDLPPLRSAQIGFVAPVWSYYWLIYAHKKAVLLPFRLRAICASENAHTLTTGWPVAARKIDLTRRTPPQRLSADRN